MQIINLTQGEAAWLSWRQQGMTASDAAVVLNRSRYKTRWRLWAEKTGLVAEADLSANPWVKQGVRNEDAARQCFEATYNALLLPLCVQSTPHPLMRASLDGLNEQGEPVELKCPSPTVWQQVCEQQTASSAYQLYCLQVQHQLLVTEAKRGWLVFYHQGKLQVFQIAADAELQAALLVEAKAFWQQVVKRQAPEKDVAQDIFTPQGEEQVATWRSATQHYRRLYEQITKLKQQLKECEALQQPYLQQLQTLMGDYCHVQSDGLQITRYQVAGRVNYAKFIQNKLGSVTDEELAPFREAASERYRVTVCRPTAQVMPLTQAAALGS